MQQPRDRTATTGDAHDSNDWRSPCRAGARGTRLRRKAVVTADRYLDVATGRYVDHPAIFIGDDGRITSIADARTVKWGADVRHIDLSGRTLVPGLIDMHVHLDGPADIGGYRGLEFTDSFWSA